MVWHAGNWLDPYGAGAPGEEDGNSPRHGRTPSQPWASGKTKACWVARVPLLVASCAAQPRCLSRSKGIRATGTDDLAAGTDQTYFPGSQALVYKYLPEWTSIDFRSIYCNLRHSRTVNILNATQDGGATLKTPAIVSLAAIAATSLLLFAIPQTGFARGIHHRL
ncbi:MAG: hypothetical protein ACYCOU_16865, partial [Sulfobacillus sp.]